MTRSICGFLFISAIIACPAFSQVSTDPWSSPATLVDLARDWKDFDLPITPIDVSYMNQPLAKAVQAQIRNEPQLALSLLKAAASTELSGFGRPGMYVIPAGPPQPRQALATLAWSYWRLQLIKPNNDRVETLHRLQKVFNSGLLPANEENRRLLEDLKQTVKAKPGHIDAIEVLVDDLTNMDQREGWDICGGSKESVDLKDVDSSYRVLWLKGFDAVPALIQHLDDGRLTRRDFPYINGPSERIARVRDVVSDILVDLSAGALAYGLNQKEVEAWWTAAKAAGEKQYLLEHVLPAQAPANQFMRPAPRESPNMPEEVKARVREMEERMKRADAEMQRNSCLPRTHLLHVIAAKYPEELPDLYKRARDHCPQAPQHLLGELLVQSPVKSKIKSQLLLETARGPYLEARYVALLALSQLHDPAACAVVADGISSIPLRWEAGVMDKTATKWTRLVTECDDPANWTLLEKMARKCDAGQRIEILWAMACCGVESDCSHRQRRLEFLGRFLDDSDFPDNSPGSISSAGSVAPQLSVRNAAAHSIASILSITPQPLYNADETAWTEFRSRVRNAVEKEMKVP